MSSPQTTDTSLEDSKKIFVGNLAFNVTDDMLKAYFTACGTVEYAKVICRGNRSLGYGFVSFSMEAEAIAAHTQLNHKMFENREINVELTKPKEQISSSTHSKNDSRFRGNSRGRRGRGGSLKNTSSRQNSTKSVTSLFIANLPYEMNDEAFADLFSQYSFETAHIVTARNGQSRGYGFVKFSDEAEQKRALSDLQNCMINERPISVRVAYEHNVVPQVNNGSVEPTAASA